MRIDVLGVGFDNLTMAEAVERGMELVRSPGAHYVVTPNPEIVEVCREDRSAQAAVNGAGGKPYSLKTCSLVRTSLTLPFRILGVYDHF